jgi:16S rRNA (adenine1518-N6/adenine1519-N6)-dimethyltransferase
VRKRWGQNFLIDPNQIAAITRFILEVQGPIIEIGPGLGALTHRLLESSRQVTALELDPFLCELLERELSGYEGFTLIPGDAREYLKKSPSASVVCGNLPYYITTELVLGASRIQGIERGVFLTQLEFAKRATAKNSESSITVFLKNLGEWSHEITIPPGSFYPEPGVKSGLMVFEPHKGGPRCNPDVLERVLRMSFRTKRKKIVNSWKTSPDALAVEMKNIAEVLGVDTSLRAEELSFDTYFMMADHLEKFISQDGGLQ